MDRTTPKVFFSVAIHMYALLNFDLNKFAFQVMNDQELKEGEEGFNFIQGTDGCAAPALKNVCLVPLSMLVHHL